MSERLSEERLEECIDEVQFAVSFPHSVVEGDNDACEALDDLLAELRSLRAECEALTERLVALRTGAALGGKDAK